jgi:hypothetical protein
MRIRMEGCCGDGGRKSHGYPIVLRQLRYSLGSQNYRLTVSISASG